MGLGPQLSLRLCSIFEQCPESEYLVPGNLMSLIYFSCGQWHSELSMWKAPAASREFCTGRGSFPQVDLRGNVHKCDHELCQDIADSTPLPQQS